MKWIYILLIGTLLLCSSGIVSAAATSTTNTTDMSKIVDMGKVKTEAGKFWDAANADNAGYMVLGIAAVGCIVIIFLMLFYGTGKSAIGGVSGDANQTNEGRKIVSNSVLAVVGLVIGLMIVGVFLAML